MVSMFIIMGHFLIYKTRLCKIIVTLQFCLDYRNITSHSELKIIKSMIDQKKASYFFYPAGYQQL